jgi:hypothetical protein
MTEKIVRDGMELCVYYSDKQGVTNALSEYEVLMYEQLCNMIASFAKLSDVCWRKQILDTEREFRREEEEHQQWLAAQDQEDKDE